MDSNIRLMGMAFNKLLEEYKKNQNILKDKIRFILESLTNQDKNAILMGYNGLKHHALKLNGIGLGNSEQKKVSFIKRLLDSSHNLQVMAINCIRDF